MSKVFTRTISTYSYPVKALTMENGNMEATEYPPIVSEGPIDHKKLIKMLTTKNPGVNFYVGEAVVSTETYSMSLETFLKHATKIEKKVEA